MLSSSEYLTYVSLLILASVCTNRAEWVCLATQAFIVIIILSWLIIDDGLGTRQTHNIPWDQISHDTHSFAAAGYSWQQCGCWSSHFDIWTDQRTLAEVCVCSESGSAVKTKRNSLEYCMYLRSTYIHMYVRMYVLMYVYVQMYT